MMAEMLIVVVKRMQRNTIFPINQSTIALLINI
jgi:hypothetical protein